MDKLNDDIRITNETLLKNCRRVCRLGILGSIAISLAIGADIYMGKIILMLPKIFSLGLTLFSIKLIKKNTKNIENSIERNKQ